MMERPTNGEADGEADNGDMSVRGNQTEQKGVPSNAKPSDREETDEEELGAY